MRKGIRSKMLIRIFNVGHGSCAYLIADSGNVMLFDCGHDDQIGFRPSQYLPAHGCSGIQRLILSHYDEDHVSDLHKLLDVLPIHTLYRNPTVPNEWVRAVKLQDGTLGPGLTAALGMNSRFNAPVPDFDFAGAELVTFFNPYPRFQETNDLSLVTFIHHPHVSIIFPGDIEQEGWMALLDNPTFQANLGRVKIFVASHHGRANGYLPKVFEYCRPDVVIISDTSIQHDTQENSYAKHSKGISIPGGPFPSGRKRHVLTTRRDGHITIQTHAFGYNVRADPVLR